MTCVTSTRLCTVNSAEHLSDCMGAVRHEGAESLLILACDADGWTPAAVDDILTSLPIPVFGGTFPKIIHDGQCIDHGTLVVGLTKKVYINIVNGLSTGDEKLDHTVRKNCTAIKESANLIVLLDGLAKNIQAFIESLYNLVGPQKDIVGCGAGSLDFTQKPCLFTNNGLIADAAIVAGLPFDLHRGVKHGWKILDGPYLITGAHDNVLETLNYRPAFQVYRELIETTSGLSFSDHDFFGIAKTYPFGIDSLNGEILVRDPISVENDALICVGNIPINAMMYILKGQASQLIESAGIAASEARASYSHNGSATPPSAVVFDCISRVLFLDGAYKRELDAIKDGLGPVHSFFGALTLGEITNTRQGPINFLNKSTVIGVF